MFAGILEKLGDAKEQQHYPANHLNRGQHARKVARRHDVAIANGANRDNREMYCLGKAECSRHAAHAEVVCSGKLRNDAEDRGEEEDEEGIKREERECRDRQSGHAGKEFLEQQSSVDQKDGHASADAEYDEPDGRHRQQKDQVRIDHGFREPGQGEYCSADQKHGKQPDQRSIKRLPTADVWMVNNRSYIGPSQPAANEKGKDRQAETGASGVGPMSANSSSVKNAKIAA